MEARMQGDGGGAVVPRGRNPLICGKSGSSCLLWVWLVVLHGCHTIVRAARPDGTTTSEIKQPGFRPVKPSAPLRASASSPRCKELAVSEAAAPSLAALRFSCAHATIWVLSPSTTAPPRFTPARERRTVFHYQSRPSDAFASLSPTSAMPRRCERQPRVGPRHTVTVAECCRGVGKPLPFDVSPTILRAQSAPSWVHSGAAASSLSCRSINVLSASRVRLHLT